MVFKGGARGGGSGSDPVEASTRTKNKSVFSFICNFLTIFGFTLLHWFLPESSYVVNFKFYNGGTGGTVAFYESRLK